MPMMYGVFFLKVQGVGIGGSFWVLHQFGNLLDRYQKEHYLDRHLCQVKKDLLIVYIPVGLSKWTLARKGKEKGLKA